MKKRLDNNSDLQDWILKHYLQLAIFNGILVLLVLLRSAGYFEPYLPITINLIYIVSLILSIFLLGMKSKGAYILALGFWFSAAILRIINIEVWAERAAVYSYEALVIGFLLMLFPRFNLLKGFIGKLIFSSEKK